MNKWFNWMQFVCWIQIPIFLPNVLHNWWIHRYRSIARILEYVFDWLRPRLAAKSALSFLVFPTWLSIQHIPISFPQLANLEYSQMICTTSWFSIKKLLMACRADSESEYMINLVWQLRRISSRDRTMAKKGDTLDRLRYAVYMNLIVSGKTRPYLECFPPTERDAGFHILTAHLQIVRWSVLASRGLWLEKIYYRCLLCDMFVCWW